MHRATPGCNFKISIGVDNINEEGILRIMLILQEL